MIKHTVDGISGIIGELEKEQISMGVDLNTGELVVENNDGSIRIPFGESKELVSLIRQKQAIYEELEQKKKSWWKRNFPSSDH